MLEPNCLICDTRKATWVIDNDDNPEFLCNLHLFKRIQYLDKHCDTRSFLIRTVAQFNLIFCIDCKRNVQSLGEQFMVFDEVWLEVCENRRGMLCLKCFEKRLGRKLTPGDFTHCRMNAGADSRKSRILKHRLGLMTEHGLLD